MRLANKDNYSNKILKAAAIAVVAVLLLCLFAGSFAAGLNVSTTDGALLLPTDKVNTVASEQREALRQLFGTRAENMFEAEPEMRKLAPISFIILVLAACAALTPILFYRLRTGQAFNPINSRVKLNT